MKLIFTLVLVFSFVYRGTVLSNCGSGVHEHDPVTLLGPSRSVTCTWSLAVDKLIQCPVLSCYVPGEIDIFLLPLMCISVLQDSFLHTETSLIHLVNPNIDDVKSTCNVKRKCFILLLLLLSGNVQPNPGPCLKNISTPDEFRARSGLGILHLNVRSLLPKIDTIKIWIQKTETDILVLSETWLNKSVSDQDIFINGYNVFRCDRPRKGGGVAIYIKNKFHATVLSSVSITKQYEFLALKLEFQRSQSLTVMGCYRPPSACSEALSSLNNCVSGLNSGEIVLVGDLNLDWLSSASDGLKSICDAFILSQLIDSPTRPNIKYPLRSSLLDLIMTNAPHRYTDIGVFGNDLSDHCAIAVVRNAKLPKTKPQILLKRDLKHFHEQAFLHDLSNFDWERISLLDDVELAWNFFHMEFLKLINKHAPLRTFRIKGRKNRWFSTEIGNLLKERDIAWAKARKTKVEVDSIIFRQLRNKCTSLIKKAKSEFYLSETTKNLNDPRKFWNVVRSASGAMPSTELPNYMVKGSVN